MGKQITEFIKLLKKTPSLSSQQFRTLRGQAINGDLKGATKGYALLKQRKAHPAQYGKPCGTVAAPAPARFETASGSQNSLDFHPLLSDRCRTQMKEA